MVRRSTRSKHPNQQVPAHGRRGVAGLVGATADALDDPEIVYPPRVLQVPDVADTPVTAGGEEIPLAGGAVTVDNQSDPPAEVTTLIAPGADLSTPGEADLSSLAGVQTIRKIGPFAVAHDTAAITGNGAVLTTELAAGAVILTAWAHITEEWNFGEATFFDIQVAPNSDPGNTWLCTKYATDAGGDVIAIQGDATILLEASSAPGAAVPLRNIVTVVEASRLVVQTYVSASAGEADVYAIIAEPA